jgi:hypothetical protein
MWNRASVICARPLADNTRESVEIDCVECIASTPKALLCEWDTYQFWVPKSQLRTGNEIKTKGDTGTLVIPRWLAKEKELPYDVKATGERFIPSEDAKER